MSRQKSELIRNQAIKIFQSRGGILRTSEALTAGIHPRILYELKSSGILVQIQRGLYALTNLLNIEEPDFLAIAKKVPDGVICLISALYFHNLTIQIPKWIDVAVPQKYRVPTLENPPVHFHWFSEIVFRSAIEIHRYNGIPIRIYSPEKTIIDCFRLRRKIDLTISLEALKIYLKRKTANLKQLRHLAKESRVTRILEPYLEALTHDQS